MKKQHLCVLYKSFFLFYRKTVKCSKQDKKEPEYDKIPNCQS